MQQVDYSVVRMSILDMATPSSTNDSRKCGWRRARRWRAAREGLRPRWVAICQMHTGRDKDSREFVQNVDAFIKKPAYE